MAQQVKNPPPVQETQEMWASSLTLEGPLEEEMAIHSSILAWKITWTEEPGGLQSKGLQRVGQTEQLGTYKHPFVISYMWILKMKQSSELKKNRHTDVEIKLVVTVGTGKMGSARLGIKNEVCSI